MNQEHILSFKEWTRKHHRRLRISHRNEFKTGVTSKSLEAWCRELYSAYVEGECVDA